MYTEKNVEVSRSKYYTYDVFFDISYEKLVMKKIDCDDKIYIFEKYISH